MSAFQEFGPLSERRRQELAQRRRRNIMIAGGSVSVIVIIAIVASVAVVYNNNNADGSTNVENNSHSHYNRGTSTSTSTSTDGIPALATSTKVVDTICFNTDYKETCTSTLSKVADSAGSVNPKELIKASVTAVSDEVGIAFGNKDEYETSEDPAIKAALEVCNKMFEHSKIELDATIDRMEIHSLEDFPELGPEFRNWLSAVRSYQETCVDAFPEGESQDKMKVAMKKVNELTSNAIAIAGRTATFLSQLQIPGFKRRLLTEEEQNTTTTTTVLYNNGNPDDIPLWVEENERRALKQSATENLTPNATVAKDGSGQFTTINDCLKAMPKNYVGRYVIYVKPGIYDEIVEITKDMENITMFGEGSQKSIVTGSRSHTGGFGTFQSATFAAVGNGFVAIAMGFRNTAGPPGHQAVALRVQSDRSIFLNCRMDGYQDTLYAHVHRQYYRACVISGTVDFIFGDASAVFQLCTITVRRPDPNQKNMVTAHGRAEAQESTGFIIHNSKIIPDPDLVPVKEQFPTYLARPWKAYSRTIIMESEIDGFISPEGYFPWNNDEKSKGTCFYAEFSNKGEGASTTKRVKWGGVKPTLTRQVANTFTPSAFIQLADWINIPGLVVPVRMGLFN